ncbi:hypothetical protein LOC54_00035 [Acetobacter sp. AN02]|uniref:hypothetical protein n=1 Tax=Acetobacter sp. AN02 TaxID=2894186 RepID=UPI00243437D6|nr:hypothetical protein [Acetobacter sp. AN02]MDG6093515.1 hypothetical protein [Acetobacter sp. AN02]
MYESHTLEVDGVFVGTIILETDREKHRFHAVHESVRPLHNQSLQDRHELVRQAESRFRRSRQLRSLHA